MTSPENALTGTDTKETFISHQQMRQHLQTGQATPLSKLITDHAHYNDAWWLADNHGWHLITDDILTSKLNNLNTWVNGNLYLGGPR